MRIFTWHKKNNSGTSPTETTFSQHDVCASFSAAVAQHKLKWHTAPSRRKTIDSSFCDCLPADCLPSASVTAGAATKHQSITHTHIPTDNHTQTLIHTIEEYHLIRWEKLLPMFFTDTHHPCTNPARQQSPTAVSLLSNTVLPLPASTAARILDSSVRKVSRPPSFPPNKNFPIGRPTHPKLVSAGTHLFAQIPHRLSLGTRARTVQPSVYALCSLNYTLKSI